MNIEDNFTIKFRGKMFSTSKNYKTNFEDLMNETLKVLIMHSSRKVYVTIIWYSHEYFTTVLIDEYDVNEYMLDEMWS